MDGTEIRARIAQMKRGSRFVYYTGLLMADRIGDNWLSSTADITWDAAMAGKVALFQHRISPRECEYVLVKL